MGLCGLTAVCASEYIHPHTSTRPFISNLTVNRYRAHIPTRYGNGELTRGLVARRIAEGVAHLERIHAATDERPRLGVVGEDQSHLARVVGGRRCRPFNLREGCGGLSGDVGWTVADDRCQSVCTASSTSSYEKISGDIK